MPDLRIGEHFIEPVNRAAGHTQRFEHGDPLRGGFLFHRRRYGRAAGVAVGDAQRVAGEAPIGDHFSDTRGCTEALKLPVIADGEYQVAVLRGKGLVGHDIGMRIAHAFGDFAADQVVTRDSRR